VFSSPTSFGHSAPDALTNPVVVRTGFTSDISPPRNAYGFKRFLQLCVSSNAPGMRTKRSQDAKDPTPGRCEIAASVKKTALGCRPVTVSFEGQRDTANSINSIIIASGPKADACHGCRPSRIAQVASSPTRVVTAPPTTGPLASSSTQRAFTSKRNMGRNAHNRRKQSVGGRRDTGPCWLRRSSGSPARPAR